MAIYFYIYVIDFKIAQVLVSQLLRMRYLTLGGLAMTEATTAVFAMVAAVAGSPLAAQKNDAFAALGSSADSFVSDICTLLRVIGKIIHLICCECES